ncbi:MAG: hemerythrin domain-containing protein [Deltaproteobacteria bacterium]|nr:hemerythrin domain-containing protein [Deltaproteobacteria bacterium]
MDAIEYLTRQHRHIESLFDELQRGRPLEPLELADVFARIADAVALHCELEEEHLYPHARGIRPEAEQADALTEHQELKEKLADLLQIEPVDPGFGPRLLALRDLVELHVEEEESELFPELERVLPEALRLDLGLAMAAVARERGAAVEGEVTPGLEPG